MKIRKVTANNRKKAFEVRAASKHFLFPYAKLEVHPTREDPIEQVFVDKELGSCLLYTSPSPRDRS